LHPRDWLGVANVLVTSHSGKPSAISCRRAVSSIYYALFHCLARDCADLLIGGSNAVRSAEAWKQVYRSLEHGFAKDRCRDKGTIQKFPKQIQNFANYFVLMQEKRHSADYDPTAIFSKLDVVADIETAERAVIEYKSVPAKHRRAFCAYMLFKKR